MAIIFAAIAGACFYGAFVLFTATMDYVHSSGYASVGSPYLFSYSTSYGDADGGGIVAPSVLLAFVGLFFAKFAINLWRGK